MTSRRQGLRNLLVAAGAAPLLALALAGGALAQTTPRVITDDFSEDRLASDYVVHAGGPMQVSDGVLRATTATPDKVITHNASGGLVDTEFTLKVNFKTNASAGTTAAIVKFLDPGNYIRLATTYSSSSVKVTKWDNGVRTDLFMVGGLFTLAPNTSYWVRARIEGNVTTIQLWSIDPALGGSPLVSRSYTLTGTNATKYGAGVAGRAGIYLDPNETTREFDDLRITELAASPPPPPPPAAGTTVSTSGSTVVATAASGATNDIAVSKPTSTSVRVSDTAGVNAGSGCVQVADTAATCANTSTTTLSSVKVTAGDGDDVVTVSSIKATIDGGSGNDRLTGGSGSDSITGGDGDDVLAGGGSDDTFLEGSAASGADTMDGGSGGDTVSYASRGAAVTVDLDGVANDGAAGEGDNAGTAVERIVGGSSADTLIGNSAANQLTGGSGDDTLTGLTGADRFYGASGNDTINARNDDTDTTFSCGESTGDRDVVNADSSPSDPVTQSSTNCEVVAKA